VLNRNQASHRRVRELASQALIEVMPMREPEALLAPLPANSSITVTCSQKLGFDQLTRYVAAASAAGHQVTPHLAARQIESQQQLRTLIHQFEALGVQQIFVIGGDLTTPLGSYTSALDLLRDLRTFEHGIRRIGVGCYPEGHPGINQATLLQALKDKQVYADYMVNQICFDPHTVITWLSAMRQAGITLPLYLGLPAPMKITKLMQLGLKIGVGQSLRFLNRQQGLLRRLLTGDTYKPEDFLQQFSDNIITNLDIEQVQIFSFNQIQDTVRWKEQYR
jgi:methylenetetrahydrofolate reductase (NADPH)